MFQRLLSAIVLVALTACAESPSGPHHVRSANGLVQRDLNCPPTIDCITESGTIDVASVDVSTGALVTPDGRTYFATASTIFHVATIPPSPVCPSLNAWNSLVQSSATYRAFVALIGAIPPSPIIPTEPCRFSVSAQVTGSGSFLTDVTPVVTF